MEQLLVTQSNHWIDFHCAAGWKITGEQRNTDEKRSDAAEADVASTEARKVILNAYQLFGLRVRQRP